MVCPFRVNIVYEYGEIEEKSFVVVEQKEEFPKCMEYDCPYYEYRSCKRIDMNE